MLDSLVSLGKIFTPDIASSNGYKRFTPEFTPAKAYMAYSIKDSSGATLYVVTFCHRVICLTYLRVVVEYILQGINTSKTNT